LDFLALRWPQSISLWPLLAWRLGAEALGDGGKEGEAMGASKPSGAQYRKLRKAAAEQARRDEAERRAAAEGVTAGELPPHLRHYGAVGAPPLSATEGVAWAHRLAQACAWEAATDPVSDAGTRRKQIAELTKIIGMTANRAQLADKVRRVHAALSNKLDLSGGPRLLPPSIPLRGTALHATWAARGWIPKGETLEMPPTARGYQLMEQETAAGIPPKWLRTNTTANPSRWAPGAGDDDRTNEEGDE
jgi:hypothetical protein